MMTSGQAVATAPVTTWKLRLGVTVQALLVVGLGLRSPREMGDTQVYLANTILFNPGYPWFLDLFEATMGRLWARGVVLAQHVLAAMAIVALTRTVWPIIDAAEGEARSQSTRLALRTAMTWVLYVPVLSYGPSLGTEALAYALFCMVLATGITAAQRPSLRTLLQPNAYLALLMLVRPQFVWMVPFSLVLGGIALYRREPRNRRLQVAALALTVALLVAPTFIVRLKNLVAHGSFTPIPTSGLLLTSMALYVSQPGDENALAPEHRAWFRAMRAAAEDKQILETQKQMGEWTTVHLSIHYWTLVKTVLEAWDSQIAHHPGPAPYPLNNWALALDDYPRADAFLVQAASRLLRVEARRYLTVVAKNFWQGAREWGVIVVFFTVRSLLAWLRRRSPQDALAAALGLMWLANRLFLSLILWYDPRYCFYTDMLLLVVIPLYAARAWPRRARHEPALA
jgi:hypothetical protein